MIQPTHVISSLFLCLWLEDLFPHLKINSNPSLSFLASRSLRGSSMIIPIPNNEHRALCLFTPLDNPAVVFCGPLSGCCSLATASLPPHHRPHPPTHSVSSPQLSPHINYSSPYFTCTQPITITVSLHFFADLLHIFLQQQLFLFEAFCASAFKTQGRR